LGGKFNIPLVESKLLVCRFESPRVAKNTGLPSGPKTSGLAMRMLILPNEAVEAKCLKADIRDATPPVSLKLDPES
jgi:hypothetical protein